MTPVTRFAPSPTGRLHAGNARIALFNWLYARAHGGRFILRLDDTDATRSRAAYAEAVQEDLKWLGLDWDEMFRQSDRMGRYQSVLADLKAAGRVYPCYETPDELEYMRNRQRAKGRPPVYDRSALNLKAEDRERLVSEGRRPHWRFRLTEGEIHWHDMVRGGCRFVAENLSDPVVIREDGTFLYLLPSAVDDVDSGVTHVLRGEDHVTNTAVQIQMIDALGAGVPVFGHLPLLNAEEGKLSKRNAGWSLADIQEAGVEPEALLALLVSLGRAESVSPKPAEAFAADFDPAVYGRAQPHLVKSDLEQMNRHFIHGLSFEAARARLRAANGPDITPEFWEVVRPNLENLGEVSTWWTICTGEIPSTEEDADFLRTAADLFPAGPVDENTWKTWTGVIKKETGRKGRNLFKPLRRALTGREAGPEMSRLLPLLGRERILARLTQETS